MKPHPIQKSPKSAARRKAEKPSRVTVTKPPKVRAALDHKAKLKPQARAALLAEGVGAPSAAAAPPQAKPVKLHPRHPDIFKHPAGGVKVCLREFAVVSSDKLQAGRAGHISELNETRGHPCCPTEAELDVHHVII